MGKQKVLIGASSFGKTDSAPVDLLEEEGFEVVFNPYGRKLEKSEIIELLQGCHYLIAGLELLDREVIQKSGVRVISRCGSGISNVDLDAVNEFGVHFFSTPEGPTQAVAEFTVGMMISLLRNSFNIAQQMKNGLWQKHVGFQLAGKSLLLVGYGKIGQRVLQLLEPFGLDVMVVDPYLDGTNRFGENLQVVQIDDGIKRADIITIHASGEETILGPEQFRRMKKGVYILNAGRGKQVDEDALLHGVRSNKVAGAWLDSFSVEPYTGPLNHEPAIITTPHIGSYTREGRLNMELDAAKNLITGFHQQAIQ